ncbi:MAG: YafY family protein [Pseudomonadota bacterium]
MRRADRLFDIVQLLRRGDLVRAIDLADALEVSKRTIYRDVAALIASGVPIEGEAGVGYLLRDGYDLPPLMFDQDEIEALVLGARIVQGWADCGLANGATRLLDKIQEVLPDHLRTVMTDVPIDAPHDHWAEPVKISRGPLRRAIRERQKVKIVYLSKSEMRTERVLRPLLMSFFGSIWNLTAWCEKRSDFRTFRIDRIETAEYLESGFEHEPGKMLRDLMARPPEER